MAEQPSQQEVSKAEMVRFEARRSNMNWTNPDLRHQSADNEVFNIIGVRSLKVNFIIWNPFKSSVGLKGIL